MEKRRLGEMHLSLTGLGLASLGGDGDYAKAQRLIHAALDSGINFFDTADIYGHTPGGEYLSEDFLGRALVGRRSQAYISTKFGYAIEPAEKMPPPFKGLSAAYTETAVEASLRRLRTDYIDLYQPHTFDPKVPIEETLGALARLDRERQSTSHWQLALYARTDFRCRCSRTQGRAPALHQHAKWPEPAAASCPDPTDSHSEQTANRVDSVQPSGIGISHRQVQVERASTPWLGLRPGARDAGRARTDGKELQDHRRARGHFPHRAVTRCSSSRLRGSPPNRV